MNGLDKSKGKNLNGFKFSDLKGSREKYFLRRKMLYLSTIMRYNFSVLKERPPCCLRANMSALL